MKSINALTADGSCAPLYDSLLAVEVYVTTQTPVAVVLPTKHYERHEMPEWKIS